MSDHAQVRVFSSLLHGKAMSDYISATQYQEVQGMQFMAETCGLEVNYQFGMIRVFNDSKKINGQFYTVEETRAFIDGCLLGKVSERKLNE